MTAEQDPPQRSAPASTDTATSATLLAGVRRQDEASWGRLVKLYGPFVFALCRRRLRNTEDARDVCQQVFQTIAERIDRFHRERPSDTFRGWIATITKHKIVDLVRRGQRQPAVAGGSTAQRRMAEIPDPGPDLQEDDAGFVRAEVRALHARALAEIRPQVKPRTWDAFWQTAVEGRATEDVAEALGMTSGAVRVAKSRVLHRLRSALGDVPD